MEVSEIEAMVKAVVRRATAAEARRAGLRRHTHRHRPRVPDVSSHWTGRGGQGA